MNEYTDCRIEKIRRGNSDDRSNTLYAYLVDKDGKILICATLDYIVAAIKKRID